MAGVEIRKLGNTSVGAALQKRSVVTLTDGRTVSLIVDGNYNNANGTDITGVAKIHLYVSTDATRTAHTLATSYTPPVAPYSSTRFGPYSMTAGADNSIWVTWQGTDNALYCTRWSYAAGVVTFVANETVQAAGAITNRFRSVDIDLTGNATAVIVAYEAAAATGNGAFHRVYARSNAATWVRAVTLTGLATGQFIRADSEDCSIALRGDGVVSNVIRFVFYATKTHTTADLGDLLREYSFNVSTAVADSGAQIASWSSALNKDQAAGTRRGMLFSISTTLYLMAGVIGAGVPKFWATKLQTTNSNFSTISTAGYVSTVSLSNYFKIDTTGNNRTYVSMSYRDNRLLFGFCGLGQGSAPRIMREVSMAWPNLGTMASKPTIDNIPRPLDSAYYGDALPLGGPIAVYGGDNKRLQSALKTYNFLTWYGRISNTVFSAATPARRMRFVSEDLFDAPANISPYAVEPTSRPVYRVRVDNVNLQPNLYGKLEVQVASDSIFTTNIKSLIQDDSLLQYFGSQDGLSGGSKQVAIPTLNAAQALTQGTWFWRSRVLSDKDTPGAWTLGTTFTVSHPPSVLPTYPAPATVIPDISTNNYNFSWIRSDTEPTDSQTEYKVIVRRRDTMVNVLDTGFVASSASAIVLNIDANGLGILEVPLDWTVQLKDADGITGPASQPVQFQIGDPPTLEIATPDGISDVTTALPTITWTFVGFGTRTQKSYRVTLFNNSTPNLVTNASFEGGMTGWTNGDGTVVQSSVQARRGSFSAFITPSGVGAAPRVEALAANMPSCSPGDVLTVEAWIRPTTANKPISIGINWYDSGGVFISTAVFTAPALAATWQYMKADFTAVAGAGKAGARAGLSATPAVGDTAYVDQILLHLPSTASTDSVIDSFWIAGTTSSYSFTRQVLVDNEDYGVTVQVQDTGGLITEATEYFHTNWAEPALASGLSVTQPDQFKIRVAWTNAAQDAEFVSYRVYRKYMKTAITALDIDDTANTWYLLYETEELLTNYVFDDYLAPLNRSMQYVVVQLVDRFGSLIESNITASVTITLVAQRYFFVPTVLIGAIASFEASAVTGDTFSRDIEQETLHVIGRGRQVQVGDDLGYSGTLNIKPRNPDTARRDRELFELISAEYNSVYIKSPFGDVVLCALGNVQTTRAPGYGGASSDFVDMTVPYTQIIDEELLPRQVEA